MAENFMRVMIVIASRQELHFQKVIIQELVVCTNKYLRDSWRTRTGGDKALNLLEGGRVEAEARGGRSWRSPW